MRSANSAGELADHLKPQIVKALLHLWHGEDRDDLPIEVLDDRPGRAARRHHAGQRVSSCPGTPASAMVATAGKVGERLCAVTARARNRPSLICADALGRAEKAMGETAIMVIGAKSLTGS